MRKLELITPSALGRAFAAAVCAILLMAAIAATACAADDPMTAVKTTVDQALTVLRDKQTPTAQRQQKLRDIVSATFDFTAMSQSAMGYYWKQITPDQQQEFQKVFITFIENSYLAKINEFVSGEVKYLSAQPTGSQFSMVKTTVIMPNTGPISLDFRLLNLNGQWQVYDVLVDGISILANYRNQFNRIMSSKGYDTLIRDLKSKEASLAASMGT